MKGIAVIALIATITIPGSSFAWGPRGGGVVIRPFFPGAVGGGHFGRVPTSIFINRALFPPPLFFPPALRGSYYPPGYAYPAYAYPAPYPYYNNYYSVPPPASVGTAYDRGYSEGYARGYEEALREIGRERYDEETKRGREQGQDDARAGE